MRTLIFSCILCFASLVTSAQNVPIDLDELFGPDDSALKFTHRYLPENAKVGDKLGFRPFHQINDTTVFMEKKTEFYKIDSILTVGDYRIIVINNIAKILVKPGSWMGTAVRDEYVHRIVMNDYGALYPTSVVREALADKKFMAFFVFNGSIAMLTSKRDDEGEGSVFGYSLVFPVDFNRSDRHKKK